MKTALFVDTNVIDNSKSFNNLFGKRAELERIAQEFQICIPRVVYDELIRHKEKEFDRQKSELMKSGVAKFAGMDIGDAQSLSFDSIKQSIVESIPHTICEMEEPRVFLEEYYPLAIRHEAPFSKGSDKGFKDACVVSSIRRFMTDVDASDHVVLVTDDSRLAECFEADERVLCYSRLSEVLKDYNESECASVALNVSESESKRMNEETMSHTDEMESAISNFCVSPSFNSTHKAIQELRPFNKKLSVQDKVRILRASADNDQISYILADEDVAAFLRPLFDEFNEYLDDRQYFTFVDVSGLPNNRLDENGNVQFSRSERVSFQAFANALTGHIQNRSWNSAILTDADMIRGELVDLLAMSTLDETLLSWRSIADVFIDGEVSADEGIAHRKIVSDFVELLKSSSKRKQDMIIQAMASRLQMLDVDVPF